jgi:hypothetical protein
MIVYCQYTSDKFNYYQSLKMSDELKKKYHTQIVEDTGDRNNFRFS